MTKIYVLDTNVLLHDPGALFSFKEHEVVIPLAVIEEIDDQKKRQDEIGKNARLISHMLDGLREKGKLAKGVALQNGGRLRIEVNHQEAFDFPSALSSHKYDNRILAIAHNLTREAGSLVRLVTKDLNLRIKADVIGIAAEDYCNDKIDFLDLYKGFREIYVSPQDLESFYRDNGLDWDKEPLPSPHEFLVLKNTENPSQSALCRYFRKRIRSVVHGESTNWGIKSRNKEQSFAFELLLDDAVQVVTLIGKAGTGKTLLALAAGLEKVVEKRDYRRLLIMRPVIPMGDDLGYLPGTKEEKLRPWMQPIYDSLEFLLRDGSDPARLLDDLVAKGMIEMGAMTYIRGRSIPNQFIICDEAQNLSPNMVKTLITRVGQGSKIILTGDPEQIDHPYLDSSSNGLTYLVEKFRNEEIAGHITLTRGERSVVAELGAKLL